MMSPVIPRERVEAVPPGAPMDWSFTRCPASVSGPHRLAGTHTFVCVADSFPSMSQGPSSLPGPSGGPWSQPDGIILGGDIGGHPP
jgi:hypothetical protein